MSEDKAPLVLVIDDDKMLADGIKIHLEASGYEAAVGYSGIVYCHVPTVDQHATASGTDHFITNRMAADCGVT